MRNYHRHVAAPTGLVKVGMSFVFSDRNVAQHEAKSVSRLLPSTKWHSDYSCASSGVQGYSSPFLHPLFAGIFMLQRFMKLLPALLWSARILTLQMNRRLWSNIKKPITLYHLSKRDRGSTTGLLDNQSCFSLTANLLTLRKGRLESQAMVYNTLSTRPMSDQSGLMTLQSVAGGHMRFVIVNAGLPCAVSNTVTSNTIFSASLGVLAMLLYVNRNTSHFVFSSPIFFSAALRHITSSFITDPHHRQPSLPPY